MSGLQTGSLSTIAAEMASRGVVRLFAKFLAPNDNSKNQPYLGKGDLSALNMFPVGAITEGDQGQHPTLKAALDFYWFTPEGDLERAPGAQLIVYPKYPEVRLSGFLRGTQKAPNALMTTRQERRILLLGVTGDRRIIGLALDPHCDAAAELTSLRDSLEHQGVLAVVPLPGRSGERKKLLAALGEVHRKGWIAATRLTTAGPGPCRGSNCGGCTLEAMLGICANSIAGPDYDGWEVKGHKTRRFTLAPTGAVTLMTPAPTGGTYRKDIVQFVRAHGYADARDNSRLNFSSPHRVGRRNSKTGLTAVLGGFNLNNVSIFDAGGSLALMTDSGEVAASWDFVSMMEKWTRKHAKAAFVPYTARTQPEQQYAYGASVTLGEGTDFLLFLKQLALGNVAYDPGIWVKDGKLGKARSQFRVSARYVPALYHSVTEAAAI